MDISSDGASIAIDDAPSDGTEVFLALPLAEVFGRVAWSAEGRCGIRFEEKLSREMLRNLPVAFAAGK